MTRRGPHTRDILMGLLAEVRARRKDVETVGDLGEDAGDRYDERGQMVWRRGAATALREVEETIEGLLRGEML